MELNNRANAVGILDLPATEDSIGIEGYIHGLSRFVLKCQTPMTIAVQGGWGTGKTSVMQMLAAEAGAQPDVHVVNFNTWQYSQFDLGDELATNLLLRIISELPEPVEKKELKLRLFKIAQGLATHGLRAATPIASHFANTILPGSGDALRQLAGRVAEREQEFELSPVEAIQKLREDFEELVAVSKKRVLVFVDDLDRLEPARAVELMEAIKLFLDVPNCVFILAIDFDVVKRGVMQKYGEDLSDRKARSFFEKIIQVPFQLPTHLYETSPLLELGLRDILDAGSSIRQYADLVEKSVGTNPRATKRLINTFALLREIGSDSDAPELDVFALLCLQSAFPSVSEYLNTMARDVDDELPADESDDDGDRAENPQAPTNDAAETEGEKKEWSLEWRRAVPYLRVLRSHFSSGTEGSKEFDAERFAAATALASVTSAGGEDGASNAERQAGKWDTTDSVEEMSQRLQQFDRSIADWGFRFKDALGIQANVIAQKGPVWTLQRTDVSSRKRVAVLNFGKRKMSVFVERYAGDAEQLVVRLREKLGAGVEIDLDPRGADHGLRIMWNARKLIDASQLAEALVTERIFGDVVETGEGAG